MKPLSGDNNKSFVIKKFFKSFSLEFRFFEIRKTPPPVAHALIPFLMPFAHIKKSNEHRWLSKFENGDVRSQFWVFPSRNKMT